MPPSADFLRELAAGLIEAVSARSSPQALADALIFTPNRRAAKELGLALYRVLGATLLAPEIRALGDVEEDDLAALTDADALELPPALSLPRRRGALARLVQGWRRASGEPELPPASAIAAADELARLLDQAAIAETDWSLLSDVALTDNLAEHWRSAQTFLNIVSQAWPQHLAEQGAVDPLTRRRLATEALVARWRTQPPQRLVVIAGSTGAAAATRLLMKATLKLPKGIVVLPGLDPELGAALTAVAQAPSHPQHALIATLNDLNVAPDAVRAWPGTAESPQRRARRRLVNEALAPAEATKGWNERLRHLAQPGAAAELVRAGLQGLTLIETDDENEEAHVAALLLRETLERPQATAALVTPEAGLARRVAAALMRWGVEVRPSAGVPLSRTLAGSFLLIVMRWARDPVDPAMLLALLKHPLCGLGHTPSDLQRLASAVERRALRGPRRDQTLLDLAARLEGRMAAGAQPAEAIRNLARLLAPFEDVFNPERIDGARATEACAELAHAISVAPGEDGDRLWRGQAGLAAAQFIEQLAEMCSEMGPLQAELWPEFAESVARGLTPSPEGPEHARIAIWGPLEARLQRRDRMILASLNEGVWPKPAPADAFLNRALRKSIGLPDPDERIGLSAHDFAQMANAPEVVLLRAKRVDDKPSVASRWLWRLRTLAAGGVGDTATAERLLAPRDDADVLSWSRQTRQAQRTAPAAPPEPRPPLEQRRLTAISPSRAVDLIRDPYADFAKRILRLTPLRGVGEDIDVRDRGTAVHKAVELFARGDRAQTLDMLIVDGLLAAGASPELIELERPLWVRAANAFLRWADARAPRVANVVVEARGALTFASSAGLVELSATADRIELLHDGSLAIIDFKTGAPKTAAQVEAGLEPQLALEAAIASRSGFGDIRPRPVSELIYFQLSTSAAVDRDKNGQPLTVGEKDEANATTRVADEALKGLQRLVENFARPDQPYRSRPRVMSVRIPTDYDRLARREEWTIEEGEE